MAPILIYTNLQSPRLHYVLQWIFGEQSNIDHRITSDSTEWSNYEGLKINYSGHKIAEDDLLIIPHALLSENNIQPQQPAINRWKHSTILFYNQPGAPIPFDIFAAVFFLISRYEEYLPHTKDKHGRYQHQQSIATQYSFLQQPVVDEWIISLKKILEQKFGIKFSQKTFSFLPTYDIDIAWKYLHKGPKRKWGGYLKDFLKLKWSDVAERKAVLAGKKQDPYDCFDWLDEVHQEYQLQPMYFLLLGKLSAFDKNADPHLPAMQALMQSLAGKYKVGIHPSYASHNDESILQNEINILAENSHSVITSSRQHYIKFTLPETYERLIAAGIKDDYSMGYASSNGFRAGTSRSFLWYNVSKEQTTELRIHPFAFMEATSKFYLKQTPEEAWKEWEQLWYAVKKVNGTFISIWHNYILGTHRESQGWRELYLKILDHYHTTSP